MSIDARAFRQTVGQFATGVTVIATEVDGSIRAMTANSFTSLSLDPPLVLFCVGKTAHLSAHIRDATGFSVNILARSQQDLSTYFAGGWKQPSPPPFDFIAWDGVSPPRGVRRRARLCRRNHLRGRRPLDRRRPGAVALSQRTGLPAAPLLRRTLRGLAEPADARN